MKIKETSFDGKQYWSTNHKHSEAAEKINKAERPYEITPKNRG